MTPLCYTLIRISVAKMKDLKEVSNWFKANKLSVNASKTNYMILGTPHMTSRKTSDNSNIVLNDTISERTKVSKYLNFFGY